MRLSGCGRSSRTRGRFRVNSGHGSVARECRLVTQLDISLPSHVAVAKPVSALSKRSDEPIRCHLLSGEGHEAARISRYVGVCGGRLFFCSPSTAVRQRAAHWLPASWSAARSIHRWLSAGTARTRPRRRQALCHRVRLCAECGAGPPPLPQRWLVPKLISLSPPERRLCCRPGMPQVKHRSYSWPPWIPSRLDLSQVSLGRAVTSPV
mgnify:CR=1 FL=1